MTADGWPPAFTLDQERILNLLTGDRFYSNPSAALREAVLNAIDAVHRRRQIVTDAEPSIGVEFDRAQLTVTVSDNGIGMGQDDVVALFTKVGASAATVEAKKESVGEFGIGVISYFMAGDTFALHTYDGRTAPIGLLFSRIMLAGGPATQIPSAQLTQGTAVTMFIRDAATFDLLFEAFPHWCRDVEGLTCRLLPENRLIPQGRREETSDEAQLPHPHWVERAHLGPVADPPGWDAMTGASKVAVLYRGVFVQEFEIRGVWGIEGSIHVDPKYFKPRLNREGFVGGEFQTEVGNFLRQIHPLILELMARRLATAAASGELDKWTEKRWASLWLSVPRTTQYSEAVRTWDAVFREIPAFERAVGNKWEPVSLDKLKELGSEVFVAPLGDEKTNDVLRAALHLLRNTGRPLIRGVRKDNSWMRLAPASFATTADLISAVFASELPPLIHVSGKAEQILAGVQGVAPLFTGPPPVEIAKLGDESPPALRLSSRLVINIDHAKGKAIVADALTQNSGPMALITIAARHAHEQLGEVAAAVRGIGGDPEILSPVRRRFIRSKLR